MSAAPAEERAEGRRAEPRTDAEANPWVIHGIAAGVVGAAVIALFFLLIDAVAGHAFWTPAALGAAVFQGRSLEPGDPLSPALVVAYTVLHGGAFVVAGLATSFALLGHRREIQPLRGSLLLATLLFVALEIFFLGFFIFFGSSVATELITDLGPGRVSVANALAALAMAGTLVMVRSPYRAQGGRGSLES